MLLALAALACADPVASDTGPAPDAELATCGPEGGYHHWIIDSLAFARVEDGVSDGFDLDGAVSTTGGATGCGIEDLVAPDGTPGVDNALGRLLPVLENTEFIAAEGLIAASIANGELVLVPELAGLDPAVGASAADACTRLALRRGSEAPATGTDGSLLAGQTIDLDPDFADTVWEEAAVLRGRVEGRPLEVVLPVQILNAALELRLHGGAIRLDLQDDGTLRGAFAGGMDTAWLREVAQTENVDPSLYELVDPLLDSLADLAPDESGQCTQLSVTFTFTAVPAHVFTDVLE